jgi:predicted transcriptional regulator
MRNEDVDWALFHMIPENGTRTIAELAEQSGFSEDEIMASLARLQKACLIHVKDEVVCALSITDMFMMNEMQHASSDIYIENGIIKVRK